MYHTTGFTKDQILDLVVEVRRITPDFHRTRGRRRILGLYQSMVVVLCSLRRNHVQQELGELFSVSQSTISRIITELTPIFVDALKEYVPTVEDLDPDRTYLIDGTLVPCWSWAGHPENYSGKHHATGVNIQVACTLTGRLAWISDPLPGKTHDAHAIRQSRLLEHVNPDQQIGDRGYVGLGMITPKKKPPGKTLTEKQKNFNTSINKIRYIIERTIANLKTWRTLHTDYRRPHNTFHETITAITTLEFYRNTL
jgi:hypothetical protein